MNVCNAIHCQMQVLCRIEFLHKVLVWFTYFDVWCTPKMGVYRSESGCDAVNGGSYHGVITSISREDSTKCGSNKPIWSRRSRGKFGVLRLAPFRVLTDLELSIPPRLAAASLLWLFCLPPSPCRSLPSIPPTFSHHGCKPLESPRYVNVNWHRCRLY